MNPAFRLSPTTVGAVTTFLGQHIPLEKDVSTYAPGRNRGWLNFEGPLSMSRPFVERPCPAKLWEWLTAAWSKAGLAGVPELGLAAHGEVGISLHRDASYAAPEALLINLGGVTWGYEPTREVSEPNFFSLDRGEVIRFDCKHRHAALEPAPDRWSIVLWQVSPKRRAEFTAFKRVRRLG